MSVSCCSRSNRNRQADQEVARIDGLVDHFSTEINQPIAFYEVLRNSIFDEAILDVIRRSEEIHFPDVFRVLNSSRPALTTEALIALGEQLQRRGPGKFLRAQD